MSRFFFYAMHVLTYRLSRSLFEREGSNERRVKLQDLHDAEERTSLLEGDRTSRVVEGHHQSPPSLLNVSTDA